MQNLVRSLKDQGIPIDGIGFEVGPVQANINLFPFLNSGYLVPFYSERITREYSTKYGSLCCPWR